jgi:hypothetical protein
MFQYKNLNYLHMKLKSFLTKQIPVIIAGVFLISSCSTYNEVACPDFRNNRNYSKKYLANNKLKRNLHKNHSVKRDNYNAFRINNQNKYKTRNSKDYTINADKTYTPEDDQIKSNPGITEFQIPAGRDEKFDLVAESGNRSSLKESPSVPLSPNIEIRNNISYSVDSKEDLSDLTKKEQRQIVKPYKKELKSAVKSYVQSRSGQQQKSALGFAIASIVCGIIGLFVAGFILGILAIIFGGIALKRIRMNPSLQGRGLAITGMVLGLIDVILLAILMLAFSATLF